MDLPEPQPLHRKGQRLCGTRGPRVAAALLLLAAALLVAAGCGSYRSQAGKYLTEARSQALGSAYALDRFGDGEVSGPFLRASLQQYAIAMKSTARSIAGLEPPPGDGEEHRREVEAVYRAQGLVQEAGHEGVDSQKAPELAQKLRRITRGLREP